jgi:hypothetical protein
LTLGNVKFTVVPKMGNGECFLLYEDEVRAGKLVYKSSQILTNQICEDLWTIGNVAIHLRHPPSRGALLRTGVHGG